MFCIMYRALVQIIVLNGNAWPALWFVEQFSLTDTWIATNFYGIILAAFMGLILALVSSMQHCFKIETKRK